MNKEKYKINTGLKDDNGVVICEGDTVLSQWGYELIVCQDPIKFDEFYGKLIHEDRSLSNMKYDLNGGKGHTIVAVRS